MGVALEVREGLVTGNRRDLHGSPSPSQKTVMWPHVAGMEPQVLDAGARADVLKLKFFRLSSLSLAKT